MTAALAIAIAATAFLPCTIATLAQGRDVGRINDEVRRRRQELQRLDRRSMESAESLNAYRQGAARIDSALSLLEAEETSARKDLAALQHHRDSIADVAGRLHDHIAISSRTLLRSRLAVPSSSALLMPEEEATAELRARMVSRWTIRGRHHIERLNRSALELAAIDLALRRRQESRGALVALRRVELSRLLGMARGEESALKRARAERNALVRLIEQKNREARQIASLVASSAERDRRAPAQSSRLSSVPTRQTRPEQATPPVARSDARARVEAPRRPGPIRFSWPSSSRRIVEGYGERTNPRTGTVTINPGINIGAPAGSAALAAADGRVSLVSWLPGYGAIVIVEHAGAWRTVYGNLSTSSVSRGARVSAGQALGSVASSVEGDFLHFEVWRGNSRVNPTSVVR